MTPWLYLVSYVLEPVSYAIYLFGLVYYYNKYNSSKTYLVMIIFFVIMIALQVWILSAMEGNLHIYNVFYVVNSAAFSYFFYQLLPGKTGKRVAIGSGVVTLFYFLFNLIVLRETYFDSMGYAVASLGIIILVFLYYYSRMKNLTEKARTMDFNFWLASSQLIYHLGSFFIFLSLNMFTRNFLAGNNSYENQRILTSLWGVHNVLLFLSSLLTWYGILWIAFRMKSPSF